MSNRLLKLKLSFSFFLFVPFLFINLQKSRAQSTFQEVVSIFQTHCVSSCHTADSLHGGLDLTGSETDIYNRLVSVPALNPSANSKGNLLIDPGHPANSFLLRKMAIESWDNYYELDQTEGELMPNDGTNLQPADIEMVRQWINYGAKQNEQDVSKPLLEDFYNGEGMEKISSPPVPPAGEGFQLRMGTFFLVSCQA